ncbi:MAG: hypothetical protein WBN66_05485, partial [Smithella sp.]
ARRMLSKTCANLIEFVQKIIFSQDFVNRNRKHSSDFTRDRKLPFSALILYFCNFIKSSYQPELNKFWKILSGTVVARHVVSKAALCKAGKKLEHEAFVELNTETVTYFNEHCSPLTWNGFFLKAVDGSTVKLPDFPEIAEHFGAWHPRLGEPVPMARISQLFDPLNKITHHALIAPKSCGERGLAATHFQHLNEKELVLLDRGYPAFWLFKLILFHRAFSQNITSIPVASARERVEKAAASRTIGYKSNFTQALSTMRDTIVVLFRGTRKTILRIISDLLETIARAVEPVRPGRKYPRNHKRAQKKFCLNYKPIL